MARILSSKRSLMLTTLSLALTRLSYSSATNSNIPTIANYFGTKGRYEEVNPHLLNDITSVNESLLVPPSHDECRPVHVTAIVRHGTRYPTSKNIRRMRRLYDLVLSEASADQPWLQDIKTSWKMWYTDDMDGKLVEKGRDDHRHLAVRLSKLFPSLLSPENLTRRRLRFQTSSKHRCVDSIEAFQQGLHKHWEVEEVWYQHEVNDELMRFFEHCRGFVEGVENNKTALAEVKKFKEGPEMAEVRRKMARKLDVPHDRVLEYKNDLKQFWKRGHGHSINSRSSCVLFHDLFSRLEVATHHLRLGLELPEAATVQVGHGRDGCSPSSPCWASIRTRPRPRRQLRPAARSFRTSGIVPYAANMLFVLYDCREGPRLQFLLNETPVQFPGMATEAMKDVPLYQDVRQRYRELLQGCNPQKECEVAVQAQHHGRDGNTEL
ncbi:hypothetical protein CRUP_008584 [Coryphaenoides rupestris]|nr:hypothetical protein CRUP_008584 [Coryphaenoides rupestris]